MIQPHDPDLAAHFWRLRGLIAQQGVEQWLQEKGATPSVEGLIYLCKFGFFTGLLTKAQIAAALKTPRPELKGLIKSWYDDHRARGCGTC